MKSVQNVRWVCLFVAIAAALVSGTAGARGSGISHFTCGGWTVVPSQSPFGLSFLSGVATVSPNDAWAVGAGSNDGTHYQTVIEHWDGTSW